jgi:hypothetical protein
MQPCIKRPWCPHRPVKAPHTHKSCTHLRQKASKHKRFLDDKTKFVVATLTLLNCLKTCWFCRKDMARIHYIHNAWIMNAIYKNVLFLKLSRVKRTQKVLYYFRIFLSYYILVLLNQERETSTKKIQKIIYVPDLFGSRPKLM